jgi:VWFA-related protein
MRPTICLLLCAITASAQQQQPVQVEPPTPVYVTAIDIVADVRDSAGKVPAGLTPADFILVEDGVEKKVIGVDYLRTEVAPAAQPGETTLTPPVPSKQKPWQTVLYFETDLSNGRGRRQTAKELMKHVDKFVRMGTVDVIFANPRPAPLLQNSRDADAVRQALETVVKSGGSNQLAMHRLEFLSFMQSSTQLEAVKLTQDRFIEDPSGKIQRAPPPPPKSNMSPLATSVDVKLVRPYIEQEVQLINRFRKNLIAMMSNYSRYAPRTLIMVTDGYDLNPLEYYSSHLNKGDEVELKSYVAQASLEESAAKMATSLASAGWVTVSVQGDTFTDGWMDDASTISAGRVHKSIYGNFINGPQNILYRPADPLRKVAEETGGEVVGNSGKIAQAMERIDDRLRITYQVDRKPDGKARKIELRARDNKLKVRAARWATSSTPDEMAEQRALAQLQEGATVFTGDLPVEATVEWNANPARKQGTMRVVSKIPGGPTRGDFRFTLAVLVPPKEAFVTSRPLEGYQLPNGEFRLRTPIDLPAATSVVVIAIEETSTGMWGFSKIKVQ